MIRLLCDYSKPFFFILTSSSITASLYLFPILRFFCGESEIRTHDTVSSTLPFQGSTIDRSVISPVAEREGFEPPVRCRTPVFKTGAFDHSATSPYSVLFHISPTTQWTWVGFWLRCSEELYTENLIRASRRTWTADHLITSETLYQLSYRGLRHFQHVKEHFDYLSFLSLVVQSVSHKDYK